MIVVRWRTVRCSKRCGRVIFWCGLTRRCYSVTHRGIVVVAAIAAIVIAVIAAVAIVVAVGLCRWLWGSLISTPPYEHSGG